MVATSADVATWDIAGQSPVAVIGLPAGTSSASKAASTAAFVGAVLKSAAVATSAVLQYDSESVVSLSLKLVESMGMQVSELASPGMPRPLALVAVTVKVSV